MLSKYSDEKVLLADLKAKKANALSYLYHHYKYWMFLEAYSYIDDEQAAQDLVQEILIDFWERSLYENVLVNLKGYFIVVIRNRALNYLRKCSRQARMIGSQTHNETLFLPDVDLQHKGVSQHIDAAIQRLPPKTKSAFIYCYINQLNHQDAADKLGVSRNTVRSQLKTAIKILRKDLKRLFAQSSHF